MGFQQCKQPLEFTKSQRVFSLSRVFVSFFRFVNAMKENFGGAKKCMEQYIFWLTECNYADSIWLAFIFPAIFVHSSGWMAACVRLDHFLWYCVCNANIYLKSFECDRNGRDWEAFEKSPLFVLLSSFVVLCWVIFVLVSSEIFQHSIFRLGWDGKRRTIKDYAFGKYQRMKWRASVLLRWQRKLQKCRQRSSLP